MIDETEDGSVRSEAKREREHGHGPSSGAALPSVVRLSGAALRKLAPVWKAPLRRVDAEAGVLLQLAEGEPQVVHKLVGADVRRLWIMTKSE